MGGELTLQYSIQPVAIVNNNRKEIEDDNWGSIMSTIELTEHFNESSLKGVDEFSHLEIIFILIRLLMKKFSTMQDILETIKIIPRLAFLHKEEKIDPINWGNYCRTNRYKTKNINC